MSPTEAAMHLRNLAEGAARIREECPALSLASDSLLMAVGNCLGRVAGELDGSVERASPAAAEWLTGGTTH